MARQRAAIEETGTQVAFVHMSSPADADKWFNRYGVPDIVRISDPEKELYTAFGLDEARVWDMIHPRMWLPWVRTAVFSRHGVGRAGPNWRQLTGVFVVHRGHILASLRHRNSAARPDYAALVHGLKLGATIR